LNWTYGQARDTGNELVSERQALIDLTQDLNSHSQLATSRLTSPKFNQQQILSNTVE